MDEIWQTQDSPQILTPEAARVHPELLKVARAVVAKALEDVAVARDRLKSAESLLRDMKVDPFWVMGPNKQPERRRITGVFQIFQYLDWQIEFLSTVGDNYLGGLAVKVARCMGMLGDVCFSPLPNLWLSPGETVAEWRERMGLHGS